MIDFNKIQKLIIRLAEISIGPKLSRFVGSDSPSIVREYGSGDKPAYPYLTFDIRHAGPTHSREANEYFDENCEARVEIEENIVVKYTVYGDASRELISTLCSHFHLPSVKAMMLSVMPELAIDNIATIKPAPYVQGTQYIEAHSFIINFRYMNVVDDPFHTYLTGVELNTTLTSGEDDYTFTTTIPTTPPPNDL